MNKYLSLVYVLAAIAFGVIGQCSPVVLSIASNPCVTTKPILSFTPVTFPIYIVVSDMYNNQNELISRNKGLHVFSRENNIVRIQRFRAWKESDTLSIKWGRSDLPIVRGNNNLNTTAVFMIISGRLPKIFDDSGGRKRHPSICHRSKVIVKSFNTNISSQTVGASNFGFFNGLLGNLQSFSGSSRSGASVNQSSPNHVQTNQSYDDSKSREDSHKNLGFMVIMLQALLVGISWISLTWWGAVYGLFPIERGDRRLIRYAILVGSFLLCIAGLAWPIMSVMSLK